MPRKVSEDKSVAYFDENHPAVEEAGFYIVEKEASDNDGELKLGRKVSGSDDGEGWEYVSSGSDE